jgi:hypothetical protein
MKFPDGANEQYWHCRAMYKGRNNRYADYDLSFSDLYNHIIHPYVTFQELIIGGQRFKNRDEIEQILIKWTPKNQELYPEKHEKGAGYFTLYVSSEDHCFESGKDFTAALLTSVQKEDGESATQKPSFINIVNTNENNNVNINSIAINNEKFVAIENIRDLFDEFRTGFQANELEIGKMKEIQDDLDEINLGTTNKEADGAIVKLKRFIKKGLDKTSEIGMKICVSALATKLLQEINELCSRY